MTLADPKPAARVRDNTVLARFHETAWDCLSCGHGRFIQARTPTRKR